MQEDLHEDDESGQSGAASIKAEISSLTAQFESLNRRASEDVPVPSRSLNQRRTSPSPAQPAPVPLRQASSPSPRSSLVDVNRNSAMAASKTDETNQRIKQVDILPGRDTNHRFKSTYNGPMGDYKQKSQPSVEVIAPTQRRSTVTCDENNSKPEEAGPETTTEDKDVAERSESPSPPPVPPRPDKTAETITVSATIEAKPPETPEKVQHQSPVKEEEPVPSKYTRTKSQEFRDYQHEFMLSSIIDFGPLQTTKDDRIPGSSSQVTSTPVAKPPPVRVRDPSPLSPVKRVSPPESQPERQKTPPPEAEKNGASSVSACQKLDFENNKSTREENCVTATKTTPEPVNNSKKIEIKPSQSFLLDLNKNANTENENTSSDSTPIIETKKPQLLDPRMEKLVGDRTNSLLRKNPTKTADDLLDWAKSQLSGYSNVKVTNFHTSWRNGLAFCGLIHHFYPDLIPYDTLIAHDIKHNCKLAFEAGEKLGIPRVIEPENMVIKTIPDKLAVITYLHQLRSALGTEETNLLYEKSKEEQLVPATGVRKSFSEGHISLFARSNDNERSDLETIEENAASVDIRPEKISEYTQRAKTLIEKAKSESNESGSEEEVPEIDPPANRGNSASPPKVIMRQKSNTPKSKKGSRLSYFDNEMQMLDAEQHEIDIQASILDRRLRETSEDDQVLYDALLQQWFTLVNKKNALLRRQMQLNILKKEDNLEEKLQLLQEELRELSEKEESRKTEEDRKREDLLLQELVLVVNKRNELVMQRDEEEKMLHDDQELDEEITLPENNHLRNNRRDECKMQ